MNEYFNEISYNEYQLKCWISDPPQRWDTISKDECNKILTTNKDLRLMSINISPPYYILHLICINHQVIITKNIDEWYFVSICPMSHKNFGDDRTLYYQCDQLDGLLYFTKNYKSYKKTTWSLFKGTLSKAWDKYCYMYSS